MAPSKLSSQLPANLKRELEKVLNSRFLKDLGKQLNGYEKKVRVLAKDFNLKSQKARSKSKRQVDDFSRRLKKTRKEVERTLKGLVDQESKLLNKSFNDLVKHLKALSAEEDRKTKKKAASKGKSKRKKTTKRKKKTTRRTRAKRTRLNTIRTIHEEHQTSVPEVVATENASVSEELPPSL